MGITIKLNSMLQQFTGGQEKAEVAGKTVSQCLQALIERYPGIETMLLDKDGSLIPIILMNGNALHQRVLDHPVNENDELWLVSAVFGG